MTPRVFRSHLRRSCLRSLTAALGAALVVAATSCTGQSFDVARVAVVAPLSGARAGDGRDAVDGARLALEAWNAAGGVHGLHLQLVAVDAVDERDRAAALADPRLVAVIVRPPAPGVRSGVPSEPADPPPTVAIGDYRDAALDQGVVALAPDVNQAARVAAAAVAFNFGPVNVAVVASGTPESAAAAQAFVRVAPGRDLRVRANVTLSPLERNYAQIAATLRSSGAQVVYVVGHGYDAGALWTEIRPRDSRIRLVLGPGTYQDGFAGNAGGFFEGVTVLELSRGLEEVAGTERFAEAYASQYERRPSITAARAYDATRLALRAIAAATDGAPPSRASVRAALLAERAVEGVFVRTPLDHGVPTSVRLALYRLDLTGGLVFAGEPEAE